MTYQPPLNGKRISLKADSNSAIETGVVTLASGDNISLGQSGSTITIDSTLGTGAAGDVEAVGTIKLYAGSSAPTGWHLCDGTAVDRTTYADLFAVIGTTYGIGDGSSTFNLPDLRARIPVGAGTATKVLTFSSRSSDTITVTGVDNTSDNEIQTGTAVVYASTGTNIGGLSAGTYYIVRQTNISFKLATSLANAVAGTVVTLSSDGTGTRTFTITVGAKTLATTGGEETHSLIIGEMPSHTHIQDAHNHTQDAHNHTQNSHTHTLSNATVASSTHRHDFTFALWDYAFRAAGPAAAMGTASGQSAGAYKYSTSAYQGAAADGTSISTTAANASSNGTVTIGRHTTTGDTDTPSATSTVTLASSTATNQSTTATNQSTTATNQSTGGSGTHNIMQPYITVNYIIKMVSEVVGDPEITAEFLRAEQTTDQVSNLSANDHIKFDTIQSTAGGSISLDTSTTYTSAGGSSIGRFTLAADKTYLLRGTLPYADFSSSAGTIVYQWYDVTNSAWLGSGAILNSFEATGLATGGYAEAVVEDPTTSTTVELRIVAASNVSRIGVNSFDRGQASAFVQLLRGIGVGGSVNGIGIQADANTVLDSGTVTLASGTNMSLSQVGQTITVNNSIGSGYITSTMIADGTIATGDIADGAITSAKILDGTIATGDLANDAVSNAKLANMATQTFKGRNTASTGDPEDLSVSTALTMLGLNRVGCSLRRVANQSTTSTVVAYVAWDTEDADASGMHATNSDTITIPSAGLWAISWRITYATTIGTTRSFTSLELNGTSNDVYRLPFAATGEQFIGASFVIPLTASTTLKIQTFQSSGSPVNLTGEFHCYRIGV